MRNLAEEHEGKEDDINDTNESKISKGITEEDFIISMLAKNILLKVTQTVISPLTPTNKT